jgi:hypothetical protein
MRAGFASRKVQGANRSARPAMPAFDAPLNLANGGSLGVKLAERPNQVGIYMLRLFYFAYTPFLIFGHVRWL